ncbi:MAG: hypothetical protein ACYC8T_00210 [Myxococcaceae bacterium]
MAPPKRKEKEPVEEPEAPLAQGSDEPWKKPAGLTGRGWAVIGAVVFLVNLPIIHYYLLRPRPEAKLALPYSDNFSDPGTVEKNYWSSGGLWRVVSGELVAPGPKNNPLWLKARLGENVAVEFDVRSMSPEGDIKVEIFGDGTDHASGYVLIHGGWNNSMSIIARRDEHGPSLAKLQESARKVQAQRKLPSADVVETGVFTADTAMRVEANPFPVAIGRKYHWRIERRGGLLRWSIDGQPFMELNDPFPLKGPDHDRFGFSSWEAQLVFDDLKVEAL